MPKKIYEYYCEECKLYFKLNEAALPKYGSVICPKNSWHTPRLVKTTSVHRKPQSDRSSFLPQGRPPLGTADTFAQAPDRFEEPHQGASAASLQQRSASSSAVETRERYQGPQRSEVHDLLQAAPAISQTCWLENPAKLQSFFEGTFRASYNRPRRIEKSDKHYILAKERGGEVSWSGHHIVPHPILTEFIFYVRWCRPDSVPTMNEHKKQWMNILAQAAQENAKQAAHTGVSEWGGYPLKGFMEDALKNIGMIPLEDYLFNIFVQSLVWSGRNIAMGPDEKYRGKTYGVDSQVDQELATLVTDEWNANEVYNLFLVCVTNLKAYCLGNSQVANARMFEEVRSLCIWFLARAKSEPLIPRWGKNKEGKFVLC